MKKKTFATIMVALVMVLMLAPVSVYAQEQEQPRKARTVYLYPLEKVEVEIDNDHDVMYVKTDWESSVFGIDTMIRIYSPLQWYKMGDRLFFIQDTPGLMTSKEAVFIGEIDGIPQVIQIGFSGELIEINSRGIVYERDGMTYYKSFYPEMKDSAWVYPEKQGWNCVAPVELYDSEYEVAVPAEAPF